jgi:hypothetical protein
MALIELDVTAEKEPLPRDIRELLREARRRIEWFQRDCRTPGFVASNYEMVYAVLRTIAEQDLAPGNSFCEWGSGFGVVACLAAQLGFEACGIEVEAELIDQACRLADDFELPVTYLHGSFLSRKDARALADRADFAWLATEDSDAPELELEPADFDLVFVYPWPDEEKVVEQLFARQAAPGAVLLSYHGDKVRLRRKK